MGKSKITDRLDGDKEWLKTRELFKEHEELMKRSEIKEVKSNPKKKQP